MQLPLTFSILKLTSKKQSKCVYQGGGLQSIGLTGEPATAATFSSALCMCWGGGESTHARLCACILCVLVWVCPVWVCACVSV